MAVSDFVNRVRIAPGTRKVSWTETAEVAIGHHRCDWCNVETPAPPDDVVIDFVRDHPDVGTLWPQREHGPGEVGWQPPGWCWGDDELLCPACRKAMVAAVKQAKAKRTGGES